MNESQIAEAVEEMRSRYVAQEPGHVPGVDYVLCRVEGCPRATLEGQVSRCGLSSLGIPAELTMNDPWCGSAATVILWETEGFFEDA